MHNTSFFLLQTGCLWSICEINETAKLLIFLLFKIKLYKGFFSKINDFFDITHLGSSVGEWLGRSLAVLGVDGSSLLTESQRCDDLNFPYA